MTKLCSACGTENRNEAQFCRACGTAFAATPAAPAEAADGSASNVCAECGFRNKPGIRYCANCGMSLAAGADSGGAATPPPHRDDPAPDAGQPPAYPTLGSVAPYAPTADTDHSALFAERTTPDIPDPDAAIALRQSEGHRSHGDTTATFADAPAAAAPNRARVIVAIVVAVLVVAGVVGWWFMDRSNPAPPQPGTVPASPVVAQPSTVTPAPTPIIIEEAPASAPAPIATAAVANATVSTPPTTAASAPAVMPAAAPATVLPSVTVPALQPAEAASRPVDVEAKRIADAKRRDKAARDKAERDGKAKALAEQREQSAAAQRNEQEAQARRRAEDAQRARAAAAAAAVTPAPVAQARGVRELCAGRGTIAEAICQSRQCGAPEHANEAICRQLREADDRRRNLQN